MDTGHTSSMTTSRTLKVRIPVTVEIDMDAWADEYGVDDNVIQIRADVKRHIKSAVHQHLEDLGMLSA